MSNRRGAGEAPVDIVDGKLRERISELVAALSGIDRQQRTCRVADYFDAFLRARTNDDRGWQTAPDVDVLECLFSFDSHGNSSNMVHVLTFPRVRLDDILRCSSGGRCRKRYAAAFLDKENVFKLKLAAVKELGKHSDWTPFEQRGNPVASPPVREYLSNAKKEQRQGRVSVKQAPCWWKGRFRSWSGTCTGASLPYQQRQNFSRWYWA